MNMKEGEFEILGGGRKSLSLVLSDKNCKFAFFGAVCSRGIGKWRKEYWNNQQILCKFYVNLIWSNFFGNSKLSEGRRRRVLFIVENMKIFEFIFQKLPDIRTHKLFANNASMWKLIERFPKLNALPCCERLSRATLNILRTRFRWRTYWSKSYWCGWCVAKFNCKPRNIKTHLDRATTM